MLVKVADPHPWKKKTYNNAISALRRAFEFGYRDYPEKRDPAAALKCARIGKKDRPVIDSLWVAKQHGHSLLTMLRWPLRVCAAWTADALEGDAEAIREADR